MSDAASDSAGSAGTSPSSSSSSASSPRRSPAGSRRNSRDLPPSSPSSSGSSLTSTSGTPTGAPAQGGAAAAQPEAAQRVSVFSDDDDDTSSSGSSLSSAATSNTRDARQAPHAAAAAAAAAASPSSSPGRHHHREASQSASTSSQQPQQLQGASPSELTSPPSGDAETLHRAVSGFQLPPPFHDTSLPDEGCPVAASERSTLSSLSGDDPLKDTEEAPWSLSPSTEALGTPVKVMLGESFQNIGGGSFGASLREVNPPPRLSGGGVGGGGGGAAEVGRVGDGDTLRVVGEEAFRPSPAGEGDSDLTDIDTSSPSEGEGGGEMRQQHHPPPNLQGSPPSGSAGGGAQMITTPPGQRSGGGGGGGGGGGASRPSPLSVTFSLPGGGGGGGGNPPSTAGVSPIRPPVCPGGGSHSGGGGGGGGGGGDEAGGSSLSDSPLLINSREFASSPSTPDQGWGSGGDGGGGCDASAISLERALHGFPAGDGGGMGGASPAEDLVLLPEGSMPSPIAKRRRDKSEGDGVVGESSISAPSVTPVYGVAAVYEPPGVIPSTPPGTVGPAAGNLGLLSIGEGGEEGGGEEGCGGDPAQSKNTDFADMLLQTESGGGGVSSSQGLSHNLDTSDMSDITVGRSGGFGDASEATASAISSLQKGLEKLSAVEGVIRARQRRDWGLEGKRVGSLRGEMEAALSQMLLGREGKSPSGESLLGRLSSICEVCDLTENLEARGLRRRCESQAEAIDSLRGENAKLSSKLKLVISSVTAAPQNPHPVVEPPRHATPIASASALQGVQDDPGHPLHTTVISLAEERDSLLRETSRLEEDRRVLEGVVKESSARLRDTEASAKKLAAELGVVRECRDTARASHASEEERASRLQLRVQALEVELAGLRVEGSLDHWLSAPPPATQRLLSEQPLLQLHPPGGGKIEALQPLAGFLEEDQREAATLASALHDGEERDLRRKLAETNASLLAARHDADARGAEVAQMRAKLSQLPKEDAYSVALLKEALGDAQQKCARLERESSSLRGDNSSLAERLQKATSEKEAVRRLINTQQRTHDAALHSLKGVGGEGGGGGGVVEAEVMGARHSDELRQAEARHAATQQGETALRERVVSLEAEAEEMARRYASQVGEEIAKRGEALRENKALRAENESLRGRDVPSADGATQTGPRVMLDKEAQTTQNTNRDFELLQQAKENEAHLLQRLHEVELQLGAAESRSRLDLREFAEEKAGVLSTAAAIRSELERELATERERTWASRQKLEVLSVRRQRAGGGGGGGGGGGTALMSPALLCVQGTQTDEGEVSSFWRGEVPYLLTPADTGGGGVSGGGGGGGAPLSPLFRTESPASEQEMPTPILRGRSSTPPSARRSPSQSSGGAGGSRARRRVVSRSSSASSRGSGVGAGLQHRRRSATPEFRQAPPPAARQPSLRQSSASSTAVASTTTTTSSSSSSSSSSTAVTLVTTASTVTTSGPTHVASASTLSSSHGMQGRVQARAQAVRRAAERVAEVRGRQGASPPSAPVSPLTSPSGLPMETVEEVLNKVRQRYRSASQEARDNQRQQQQQHQETPEARLPSPIRASRSPPGGFQPPASRREDAQRTGGVSPPQGRGFSTSPSSTFTDVRRRQREKPGRGPVAPAEVPGLMSAVRDAMLRYYGSQKTVVARFPGERVSLEELRSAMAPCGLSHLALSYYSVLRGDDLGMGVPRVRLFAALKSGGGAKRAPAEKAEKAESDAPGGGGYAAAATSARKHDSLLGGGGGARSGVAARGSSGGGRGGSRAAKGLLTSSEIIKLEILLHKKCLADPSQPKVTANELLSKCLTWDKATRRRYHNWLRDTVLALKE